MTTSARTAPPPLEWTGREDSALLRLEAKDHDDVWMIAPRAGDVAHIHFTGRDADGTIVCSTVTSAFAESVEEAMIVVETLRGGTETLPDWREQLETAGFVRTYPDAPDTDGLSELWNDVRPSGHFGISVRTGAIERGGTRDVSVRTTYQAGGSNRWHNVCFVSASMTKPFETPEVRMRGGLPEGVDPIRAGVAASIAIAAARKERGGRFAEPLGGRIRDPKPKARSRKAAGATPLRVR